MPDHDAWRQAEARWQATLAMWAIEDAGGYMQAVLRQLDGPPPRHLIWEQR